MKTDRTYTAFAGQQIIASGSLEEVALKSCDWNPSQEMRSVLILEDQTGNNIDLDLRGDTTDVLRRLKEHPAEESPATKSSAERREDFKGEVSLLPRHWAWLKNQQRSTSATLRSLIDAQIKQDLESGESTLNAAYQAMSILGGDLPGYEESSRALFAGDREKLAQCISLWPADIENYIHKILRA